MSAAAALSPVPTPTSSASPTSSRTARPLRLPASRARSSGGSRSSPEARSPAARQRGDALARALHADLRKPDIEGFLMDIGIVASDIASHARRSCSPWMKPERVPTPLALQPGKSWHRARAARRRADDRAVELPDPAARRAARRGARRRQLRGRQAVRAGARMLGRAGDAAPALRRRGGADASSRAGWHETTALLAERCDHIFFTGPRPRRPHRDGGRRPKHLTPVTLELGGKSPTIVARRAPTSTSRRAASPGASSSTAARPASRPTTCSSTVR